MMTVKDHELYFVWRNMKARCRNPKTKHYKYYGGRGIKVCRRWEEDFWAFVGDMPIRPTPTHQIDRIDNDGDYTPDNCRWATPTENIQNSRAAYLDEVDVRNIRHTYADGNAEMQELALEYNVHPVTISSVVNGETWKNIDGPLTPTGYGVGQRKISDADVVRIREDYSNGKGTHAEIAKSYSVHATQIGRIVRGARRQSAGGPITRTGGGEHNKILSDAEVFEMRHLYAQLNTSHKELSERYNISEGHAGSIVRGEKRRGASGPITTGRQGRKVNRFDVKEMRERYRDENISQKALAEEYDLKPCSVSLTLRGEIWEDADGPIYGVDF